MKQAEFLKFHAAICEEARSLTERKGADYSGKDDALRNLKACGRLDICEPEVGVLVRLTDKLSRLAQLVKHPPKVVDESIRDSTIDVINYAILFLALNGQGTLDET